MLLIEILYCCDCLQILYGVVWASSINLHLLRCCETQIRTELGNPQLFCCGLLRAAGAAAAQSFLQPFLLIAIQCELQPS